MKKFIYGTLIFLFSLVCIRAQVYKVEYKSLDTTVLSGSIPTICILEDSSNNVKLYNGLVQYDEFKNKFTCYSTSNLNENKEILGAEIFNPSDNKFLKSLNDLLSIKYLLEWKPVPDSDGVYLLNIYSTSANDIIYTNKFFPSINSNPVKDVEKLLVENSEPVYKTATGQIEITSNPSYVHFKLYKNDHLVKEWSGSAMQQVDAGNYKLSSEAEGYKSDERDIDIVGDKKQSIKIQLVEDYSVLPHINSSEKEITNIVPQLENNQLAILYDLSSDEKKEFDIGLILKERSSQKTIALKNYSGDAGDNITVGKNKKIVWQYDKDMVKKKDLSNYDIILSINRSSGIAWYYYAGSAVVAGGAAVLLLGKKGTTAGTQTRTQIDPPPGRP